MMDMDELLDRLSPYNRARDNLELVLAREDLREPVCRLLLIMARLAPGEHTAMPLERAFAAIRKAMQTYDTGPDISVG